MRLQGIGAGAEASVSPISPGASVFLERRKCFHGLTYDPVSQTGCVLCRKEQAVGFEPGAAKPRRASLRGMARAIPVALVILALPFIWARWEIGNRAKVGESCGNGTGCVREAGCIVPKAPNLQGGR
jgi:hypothetical protein